MPDQFVGDAVLLPARSAFAVTPSDATNYLTGEGLQVPKALYVGGFGNIVVQLVGDSGTVTFSNVPAGAILPIRPQRILAATTATAIVGLR
jgi:hypothetical protein